MAALFPKIPIENHLSAILLPGPKTVFGKEIYPQKTEERTKQASFLQEGMSLK